MKSLMRPVVTDYFAGSPVSALRADQTLSDDALERARYHGAHLVPLVRGKRSIRRLMVSVASTVWSVERTRWPVSAAERAIWALSASLISPMSITSGSCLQHAPQGPRKGGRIRTHLALVYDALVVPMNELDGILDGDHVSGDGVIDHVNHRG